MLQYWKSDLNKLLIDHLTKTETLGLAWGSKLLLTFYSDIFFFATFLKILK